MVNVRSIAEMGAYVHLLEYNNIEGMILLSELSRRRIRSINKLIRVGRNECVVVIRVDKDKGKLIKKVKYLYYDVHVIYATTLGTDSQLCLTLHFRQLPTSFCQHL